MLQRKKSDQNFPYGADALNAKVSSMRPARGQDAAESILSYLPNNLIPGYYEPTSQLYYVAHNLICAPA